MLAAPSSAAITTARTTGRAATVAGQALRSASSSSSGRPPPCAMPAMEPDRRCVPTGLTTRAATPGAAWLGWSVVPAASLTDRRPEIGADELVVAGMMTSMCVDATVRAAVDMGFAVTVAGDACAAPDIDHGDVAVSGDLVHAAFLGALADGYATVVPAEDVA